MKVLHILDSLSRGGTEMLTLDVCRNAAANGLDLSFLATGGGTLEPEFRDSGAMFFRLQRRLPIDPSVIAGIRRIIRENSLDVLHSHQPVDALHAYFAAKGLPTKRVLSFQGFIPDLKNRLAIKFLVPRMHANVACSQGLMKHLSDTDKIDTSNFEMIYNGVDRKRIEYSGEGLAEELGLPSGSLLIGMVAHFYPTERKDHATLCRAFARIAGRIANAHLIIVGRVEIGAEAKFDECRRVIEKNGLIERVHFIGERSDLAKIIHSLDIYVFSSFYEGLPIALMEALLSRKVCVLSDIAPHLEISHEGKYAETFKTGDAESLADKLLLVAHDECFRTELSSRAYDFAVQTFSIEAHIAELKKLYAKLLS